MIISSMKNEKNEFISLIKANIKEFGFHITIVNSYTEPRYAYSIGLNEKFGFELIFAGGIIFYEKDIYEIFNSIATELNLDSKITHATIKTKNFGKFSFSAVDNSWSNLLVLGVYDFYNVKEIKVFQIKPEAKYYTLDIPDMEVSFDDSNNQVWKWLNNKWDLPVPETSTSLTNIQALKGEYILEVFRCDEDEWEMFSENGTNIDRGNLRIVSVGALIGIDPSLTRSLTLEIGKGIWRKSIEDDWNNWE